MPQTRRRRQFFKRLAVPENFPAGERILAGNAGKAGGLAGAVRANQRDAFTGGHVKADAIDCINAAEMLDEPAEDHGLVPRGVDALGAGGGPRALLVMGSNPVVSAPRAAHVQSRLASLDCLVVADVVLSETAAMADVVLPVAQWAEEDGTTTDLQGRVLLRRRALDPPAGVRTDLQVIAGLAERLGCPSGFPV